MARHARVDGRAGQLVGSLSVAAVAVGVPGDGTLNAMPAVAHGLFRILPLETRVTAGGLPLGGQVRFGGIEVVVAAADRLPAEAIGVLVIGIRCALADVRPGTVVLLPVEIFHRRIESRRHAVAGSAAGDSADRRTHHGANRTADGRARRQAGHCSARTADRLAQRVILRRVVSHCVLQLSRRKVRVGSRAAYWPTTSVFLTE